jgi:flagellar motor switch protein FliM
MSKILSQDEIDALLSSAPTGETVGAAAAAGIGGVISYNFRRPDRISKEQIRSLHFLHDRFARNVASSLAAYLRTMTELSIVSVEQFSYSEFLMSLADPTAYYAIALSPLDGIGALELNPTIAFTIVDRMLGGSGTGAPPNRALTEIEQNVIDAVVRLVLEHLTETWRAVFELQFRIQARETRPQMLQVAGPNEVIILLVFDLKVGDIRGMLNLCIPAAVIEATGSSFVQGWQRTHRDPTAVEQRWLHANLGRVPLDVTTTIETTLRARELVRLERGDVLSLGVPVQAPVAVRVGKSVKFSGRLTTINGHAALRVERTAGQGDLASAEGT